MANSAGDGFFDWINDELDQKQSTNSNSNKPQQTTIKSINELRNKQSNISNNNNKSGNTGYQRSAFKIDLTQTSAFNLDLDPPKDNTVHTMDLNYLFGSNDNQTNNDDISAIIQPPPKPMDLNYLFNANKKNKNQKIIVNNNANDISSNNNNNNINDDIKANDISYSDGFDCNSFKIIRRNTPNRNILYSPFSLFTTLCLCMCGAQNNTLKQMMNVLFPTKKSYSPYLVKQILSNCDYFNNKYNGIVKIVNKLWIDYNFQLLYNYIDIVSIKNIELIDFSQPLHASRIINKWCSNKTKNKIDNIITNDLINNISETKIIITNAIYFKGEFLNKFDKKDTVSGKAFYSNNLRNKRICNVSMMYSCKQQIFALRVNGIYDVIKLKYKHSKLSLILVLNNDSNNSNNSTLTIEEIVGFGGLFDQNFGSIKRKLHLYLPKFRYEMGLKMNNILQDIGIKDAFNNNADFTNMCHKKGLKISNVIQKSIIEVDETGTQASSISLAAMSWSSGFSSDPNIPTVTFDHPFVFYIFDDEKKVTLFSGRFVGK